MRALPVTLTLMGQARVRKHDTDLSNRLTDQNLGLLGRDAVLKLTGLRNAGKLPDRDYPAAPVNLVGEMRATGLMEPEEGSAGIVHTSGLPGAG